MKDNIVQANWWKSLTPEWRQAFALSVLKHADEPGEDELQMLSGLQVLRLAGPSAPFSNCSIELNDLSGVAALTNLETLIVSHHKIETIEPLAGLSNLKSLFLLNNCITSLQGIEGLIGLEQLYVQHNRISSIKELRTLLKLKEVYISDNLLASLEGLTEEHEKTLETLVCRPNEYLRQKEILRVENTYGIICR